MQKDAEVHTVKTETKSPVAAKVRYPDRCTTVIFKKNFEFIQNIQHLLSADGQSIDHGILSSAALDLVSQLPNAQERIIQRSLEIIIERRKGRTES